MSKKYFGVNNPISFLNDSKLNVKYDFTVKNGFYNLIFVAKVAIERKCYYGTGYSKKEAKYKAAERAVEDFFDHRKYSKIIASELIISSFFVCKLYICRLSSYL